MPRLSPFQGLVFDTAVVGPLEDVTAPPYDVISDDRRLEYLRASPFSVVHLDLAEGSDDPRDPASRYGRAAGLLAEWETGGAVRRAAEPQMYVYEMTAPGGQVVSGVVAAMRLEDWGGTVIPHEQVDEGPVRDRLALLEATATHLSPIYGTIDGPDEALAAIVERAADRPAPFTTLDERGVRHRMWAIAHDEADLRHLVDTRLLIADGHHRYTTALHYRDERRRRDGAGPWDHVLTLVVDASTQRIPVLPFHRVQIGGRAPDDVGEPMADLDETLADLTDDPPVVGVAVPDGHGGVAYRRRRLDGGPPAVRALHAEVIDRLDAPAALRYVPDAGQADSALRRGEAVAVYLLPPTSPGHIAAVAGRGERLPQKSTYFWPKPRTGMVMMPLDPAPDRTRSAPRADRAS
jgi:uncharacterized protein (DUF1015 family)